MEPETWLTAPFHPTQLQQEQYPRAVVPLVEVIPDRLKPRPKSMKAKAAMRHNLLKFKSDGSRLSRFAIFLIDIFPTFLLV